MSMIPKIELLVGRDDNRRKLKIELPFLQRRIGVLVSGGLDSALLYYLLKTLVTEKYTLTPYVINRNDGSLFYAKRVIEYVDDVTNSESTVRFIDINQPDSNLQVSAGIQNILSAKQINVLYIGIIETLPMHCIGVPGPYVPIDSIYTKFPFKNLNKTHIVDCIKQLNQEHLFAITQSCVYNNNCGICNRCNERHWAFEQLNLVDTGQP